MKTNADMENVDCKSTLKQDTEGALYIAHSENCYGELQTMKQHSEGVARMMKSFALSGEYVDVYTYCGCYMMSENIVKDFRNILEQKEKKNLMQNGELIWQEWTS